MSKDKERKCRTCHYFRASKEPKHASVGLGHCNLKDDSILFFEGSTCGFWARNTLSSASEPAAAIAGDFDAFEPDEKIIIQYQIDRMRLGRERYGKWELSADRDNTGEALEEILDACQYLAAAIIKLRRGEK